jgi:phosphate transport system ATP-binding protein
MSAIMSTSPKLPPQTTVPATSPGLATIDGHGPSTKPALSISNLNFYYGTHHALHDISLRITDRIVTALIGPSGCGKSTFLRTLNRMYEVVPGTRLTGSVLLRSEDLFSIDLTHLRRRVGMVFQSPNPFPKSIFDNVTYAPKALGGFSKGSLSEIAEESLRRAALWEEVKDKLHKSALSLSGGQQQRLCIARALALKPEVLLLDEPCSALDPISTAKIEELLVNLKDSCTIVLVTHNMQQAARIADYTGFFLMGKLIELDRSDIIFEKPSRQETEDYVTGRFG